MFHRHDRVMTNMGPGTVVYTRNEGPDYVKQCAVSVLLDSKKNVPGHSGTILGIDRVRHLTAKELETEDPVGFAEQVKLSNEIIDEVIAEEKKEAEAFVKDHFVFVSIP